jgi:hypothetical protein
MEKPALHERFLEKLTRCELDTGLVDELDWEGLRSIIDAMRGAFHSRDAAALLEFEESTL